MARYIEPKTTADKDFNFAMTVVLLLLLKSRRYIYYNYDCSGEDIICRKNVVAFKCTLTWIIWLRFYARRATKNFFYFTPCLQFLAIILFKTCLKKLLYARIQNEEPRISPAIERAVVSWAGREHDAKTGYVSNFFDVFGWTLPNFALKKSGNRDLVKEIATNFYCQ